MSKLKKSYYEGELYLDTTTGRYYRPKDHCEICGIRHGLQIHHYLPQSKALRSLKAKKVKEWSDDFIKDNQFCTTVCSECHYAIHSFNEERFKQKYGRKLLDYIYKHRSV